MDQDQSLMQGDMSSRIDVVKKEQS